jgi:hypothetical protein
LISDFYGYSDPVALWNQPVKDDAEIGFYSKEHDNERCIHGEEDTINGHQQFEAYFRHNDTSFSNDMEVPVQNNFEYTQFRQDVMFDNYDVQYFVSDPSFDPMANV